jgi:hypothetical protein
VALLEDGTNVLEHQDEIAALRKEDADGQRPLVWALRDAGIPVDSIWEFVNGPTPVAAIPILLRHLRHDYPFRVKDGIVRSLMVKEAPREAWELMYSEYIVLPGDQDDMIRYHYKVTLGMALGTLAKKSDFDAIAALVRDEKHGVARCGLIRARPRKDKARAGDVLLEILEQKEV